MTTLRIEPGSLSGTLRVPSSKSMGHRALICAALAGGTSQVEGVSLSQDILATCACLRQLGAKITSQFGSEITSFFHHFPSNNYYFYVVRTNNRRG